MAAATKFSISVNLKQTFFKWRPDLGTALKISAAQLFEGWKKEERRLDEW